ncbi:hypothetical protein MLD38_035173 [Melastoma candidum]|uniref:Uncharacterized protein n=1 Tax=Melastoma candidum TaxID=119954 RepID=A0ACB9MDJ4_9MYRT|nr:hypothetical protein MLD38_035173 [Melastoma candidum]
MNVLRRRLLSPFALTRPPPVASGMPLMENAGANHWTEAPLQISIKGILAQMLETLDEADRSRLISLGIGDPTAYSAFRTPHASEDAIEEALRSRKFNGYAPTVGLPQSRRAVAEHLSRNLPYKITPDDVFLTSGCTQAIDVTFMILSRPGANVLIPRPGFPMYELVASIRQVELRHYNLLPERGWEVDLESIKALADENTVALVIINPGNPCGNVYNYQHLKEIAETARDLKNLVVADEVYGHLVFRDTPFVPMGTFASIVPVLTLGSMSKRWLIPGWRLGWFVTTDPSGKFRSLEVMHRLKKYFDLLGGLPTFVQAAVPRIIKETDEAFFKKTVDILRESLDICFSGICDIPCLSCPQKPEGSMTMMAKLDLSMLEDISDDIDFCFKLAKEEAVIILPGIAVGLKDWLRITFAADPSSVAEALRRLKSFCQRHSKPDQQG